MKKYIVAIIFTLLLTPIYTSNAQDKGAESYCATLHRKKSAYETLQQQHVPETVEQQALFSQFQRLRANLESLRSQNISTEVLSNKSAEIETLKQSIQANQQALESKIQNLDASISAQFFQEAKSIIILTLQCTQSKVNILSEKFLSTTQFTQNESKIILVQNEIQNLNSLYNDLGSSINYLNQISDRKELKSEQEEMNLFLNKVKSTIAHSRKVYNFVTFESRLNQLENIINVVKNSSLISNLETQESITSRFQKLKKSTEDLSFFENTGQQIEFLNGKKQELRNILEQLKSSIESK